MSIDALYGKVYNKTTYNCAHFVVDAWKHITGVDIGDRLSGFMAPPAARVVVAQERHGFNRLPAPVSPCLALMSRRRSAPHVGIYYIDRILHLHEYGVEFQPVSVAMRGFSNIRYYACL
jgi:hypothetical protein